MTSENILTIARTLLTELTESGFIPFASPAPSSTEKVLKNAILRALTELNSAAFCHEKLYHNAKTEDLFTDILKDLRARLLRDIKSTLTERGIKRIIVSHYQGGLILQRCSNDFHSFWIDTIRLKNGSVHLSASNEYDVLEEISEDNISVDILLDIRNWLTAHSNQLKTEDPYVEVYINYHDDEKGAWAVDAYINDDENDDDAGHTVAWIHDGGTVEWVDEKAKASSMVTSAVETKLKEL